MSLLKSTLPAGHRASEAHGAHAAHASDLMHVIARIGAERFAFRVAEVEEVLDSPALLAAPRGHPGLRGQVVHREQTLRAYSGAWALGIRADTTESTAIRIALVLRGAAHRVALLVDEVEDLTSLDPDTMRSAPPGIDPAGLLRGVYVPRATDVSGAMDTGALIGVVNTPAVVARVSA